MSVSAALARLARESLSALLIAIMLLSAVAQARQLAAMSDGKATFALCEPMADGTRQPADSVPPADLRHGCMQCCLVFSPVLPMQTAIGLVSEWRKVANAFSAELVVSTPLFLVQEARGPPAM